MKKVYDKTITRLAEMSRACYMHATEVADEKRKGIMVRTRPRVF